MGRNFPSATQLVHEVIGDLKPFSEMLPPHDRWILDRFYEYAMNNRAAIANAASLMPLEATLLIILLEERKRTNHALNELQAEIEELKKDRKQLMQPEQTKDDGP
jgi:hypothetical protein